jgi:hypothetical protein
MIFLLNRVIKGPRIKRPGIFSVVHIRQQTFFGDTAQKSL